MKDNYQKALGAVLKHEGGYVNHPKDPGGATMKGVTQAVYDAYRRNSGAGPQSVAKIDDYELQQIYRRQYWDAVKGDDLPSGVDYCTFDFAVNSGVRRAAEHLQAAIGAKVDGNIGLATLAKANEADRVGTINAMCASRMKFLKGLKTWPTFGKGWKARVEGVNALAIKMVSSKPQPAPQPVPAPSAPVTPAAPVSPPAQGPAAPAKPVLTLGRVMAFVVALIVAAAGYFFKNGG